MSEAGLEGVGRTALWTLHCRAHHAVPGVLEDPEAKRLVAGLDAGLLRSLGRTNVCFAERAARYDSVLGTYLAAHPGAAVVSLGEGLETQRFRVRGHGRWTSVDLPEVLAVRARFIAADATHAHLPASATDVERWLPALGEGPAFVVAQGLFMYLEEAEVERIVGALRARGGLGLMFDVVPPWLTRLSRLRPPVSRGLRVPRMPWGATEEGLRERLRRWVGPEVPVRIHPIGMPAGPFPGRLPTIAASLELPAA
ncbi:MAG: class I SAM-dependent methyltransferase [Myxococcota bacterium]